MAVNKSGTGREAQLSKYKLEKRQEKNRKIKLERALKRNPENKQIETALKNINYRRRTPTTPFWSATRIKVAMLYKEFTGKINLDIFSNNEKVSSPALMTHGNYPKVSGFSEKSMFSIGARAHTKGVPTWN